MTRSTGPGTSLSGLKVLLAVSILCLALVPVVGAAPAAAGPTGFSQETGFSCQSGRFYSISGSEGKIYEIDSSGGVKQVSQVPHPGGKSRLANALGIGRGGKTAYALWRNGDDKSADIYQFEAGKGWRHLDRFEYPKVSMVAGGVQFSTGDFYFGGFYKDKTRKFHLYRYLSREGRVEFAGQFDTGLPVSGKANGDLAFDSAGNLYIIRHAEGKQASVYTVTKKELDSANGGTLRFSQTSGADLFNKEGVNGAAFLDDGSIILGDAARAKSYDPADFSTLTSSYGKLNDSSDLASCTSPATFVLKKDVVERVNASDQFDLKAFKKDNGFEVAGASTSGKQTGLQEQPGAVVGIFPLKNNQRIDFNEKMSHGAKSTLGDYATTWACYADGATEPIAKGEGPAGSVTLPATPSVVVECVLKNAPKPKTGSVTWKKVDGSGGALAGSGWQIIPDAVGQAMIEVTDNTGDGGYLGRDVDKAEAGFKVDGLPFGTYTLRESTVPGGYSKAPDRKFTITEAHATSPNALGNVVNTLIKGQVTWEKVDAAGKHLGASSWTFKPTKPAGAARTIVDCIAGPCTAVGGDRDARPGYFKLEDVAYGTYTLAEAGAPTGYVKSTETKTVQVSTQGGTVAVGKVVNQALPKVAWSKTKSDGSALGGSRWSWEPTAPAGAAVEVVDCEAISADKCTGLDKDPKAGGFLLEGVELGEYTLTETGQPEGYVLDSTPHTVSVTKTSIGKTVTAGSFVNQAAKGSVAWSKVDAANGKALAGSSWTLTGPGTGSGSGAGELVVEDCVKDDAAACTGADKDPVAGGFQVDDLSFGEYKLVERAAPVGYRLDATEHPFTLDATHQSKVFEEAFKNSKATVPVLPLTGGMGADAFLISGGALGALAILGAVLRRRRRQA
ncbi:collagen binding domain-containing protein [Actinomyces trachealis]|uniref:MSCRAMM family protein n=2 Tax=Actinomyces trachealis TaxID=2763540 RepID=UPI001892A048|nr:SpaA isopeptide-forming pilin-related protein [Actinomyces trachealis]